MNKINLIMCVGIFLTITNLLSQELPQWMPKMPENFEPPEKPSKLTNDDLSEKELLKKCEKIISTNMKISAKQILTKEVVYSNLKGCKIFRVIYRIKEGHIINIELEPKTGKLMMFINIKSPPNLLEEDIAKEKALEFLKQNNISLPKSYEEDIKMNMFGEYETVYEVIWTRKTKNGIKAIDSILQVTINAYTGDFINFKNGYDLLEKYPDAVTTKEQAENLVNTSIKDKYSNVRLKTELVIIKPATFGLKEKVHSIKVWFVQVDAMKKIEDLSRHYKLLFFIDINEPKIIKEIK